MANPDNLETQAPEGTYQFLSSIQGRTEFDSLRLGNARTSRFVRIVSPPDGSSTLKVEVRVRYASLIKNVVGFSIDSSDGITGFEAMRVDLNTTPITIEPFGPPTLAQVLRVIKHAQKIEPKLKPRKQIFTFQNT